MAELNRSLGLEGVFLECQSLCMVIMCGHKYPRKLIFEINPFPLHVKLIDFPKAMEMRNCLDAPQVQA